MLLCLYAGILLNRRFYTCFTSKYKTGHLLYSYIEKMEVIMLFILIVVLIIFIEWKLKNYVEAVYNSHKKTFILNDRILVRKYHNYGAFLNILEKKKKLLHMISLIFTLLITVFFLLTLCRKGNHVLKLGLSLLLGGAFSNTYDRLSRNYVVDYFSFCSPFTKLNQIVFNISDFCIIIGALLTVLHS